MTIKKYTTKISEEKSQQSDAFSADTLSTYGYDVVKEILPHATFIDYLFLMLSGERPNRTQSILLEKLCMLLLNPGIRDTSVRTAMNAGVGDAPPSAVLISAISGGSGQCGGSREIKLIVAWLTEALNSSSTYGSEQIRQSFVEEKSIWPDLEHTPGFTKFEPTTSLYVKNCLEFFSLLSDCKYLKWLASNHKRLSLELQNGLSLNAVIAAAMCDLGVNQDQAEYLFLILRLPAAAAFATEQKSLGWRHFPFFTDTVTFNPPGNQGSPPNVESLVEGYLND